MPSDTTTSQAERPTDPIVVYVEPALKRQLKASARQHLRSVRAQTRLVLQAWRDSLPESERVTDAR